MGSKTSHTGKLLFQLSLSLILLLLFLWNFEFLPRFTETTLEKTPLKKNIVQVVQDNQKNWILGGQDDNNYYIEKNGIWTKSYVEENTQSWIDMLEVDKFNNINAGIVNKFEQGFSYEIHKYNPNGNLGWRRQVIQTNNTFTGKVLLISDFDGNIYSSVKEHSATLRTTFTKFDSRGDSFWQHAMDIDDDWSLAVASGKLIVAANNALWIANSRGISNFASVSHNTASLVADTEENILLCGHSNDGDVVVSKWSSEGEELWTVEHETEESNSKLISCEAGLDNTIHLAVKRENDTTLDVMLLHSKDGSVLWNDAHTFDTDFVLNDMFFNSSAESFKVIVTLAGSGESILLKWKMPTLPIAFIGICIYLAFDFMQLFLILLQQRNQDSYNVPKIAYAGGLYC